MNIELLQWVTPDPDSDNLPKTTRNVMVRTDDPLCPVWPAFFDGHLWRAPDTMPLGREVIEWSEMPIGSKEKKQPHG